MKILLAVIIISLSFISNNSLAVGKEYILKSKCKNEKEAQSCTECNTVGNASFKIDKSLASVLMIYKLDTGESDSILHENCKIFDSETFVCEHKGEDGINLGTFKLTNGIYTHIFSSIGSSPASYSCAIEIKSILNWLK